MRIYPGSFLYNGLRISGESRLPRKTNVFPGLTPFYQ